jgi:hypothetical protein
MRRWYSGVCLRKPAQSGCFHINFATLNPDGYYENAKVGVKSDTSKVAGSGKLEVDNVLASKVRQRQRRVHTIQRR